MSSRTYRVAALVLVVALTTFANRMHTLATYGRITRTAREVLSKNHDLMVGSTRAAQPPCPAVARTPAAPMPSRSFRPRS